MAGFAYPAQKLQANFWDMKSFYSALFAGRLGRKHYFISIVVLLSVGIFIAQVAAESGPLSYVLVLSSVYLLKTILDAKRLRDVRVPGKVAPIAIILFLVAWAPFTYDVMTGTSLPYSPTPPFLILMGIFIFVAHWYLLLAKGEPEGNRYGKSTSSLGFKRALRNETAK